MPFLGDVRRKRGHTHVNGDDVMYSFRLPNNRRPTVDNDRAAQRNDTVTNRYSIELHEGDTQRIWDMNLTSNLASRATGATSSDNIPTSVEHFMDLELSQDSGNVTRAVTKVTNIFTLTEHPG